MTDSNGVTTSSVTPLQLTLGDGPQTRVRCELGMTINIQNFQNVKVHVALEAPSNLDTESLDRTYEFIKNWCDAKISALKAEVEKDAAG